MPWNEPGGSGNQPDPWGSKKNQSPPDLDKLVKDFINKLRSKLSRNSNNSYRSGWKPSIPQEMGFSLGLIALILGIIWFFSGLFIVNPAEEAVILRFGKYADVLQPGLHWFARFIDTKYTVDVQKIYSFSLEGDFLTKSSEQGDLPTQYILDVNKKASLTLDQSKNLVNVELNVQYRINDPRAYLFNVVNSDDTVHEVAAGALSDAVGKMKLDEVLTTGRELLSSNVLERLKQVLVNYQTGLEVVAVTLRKVQAPDQVRAAFNDVNRADQDKATYIQQAQAYASKVVPLAQGDAARILADAAGYQQQVVLASQASVAKYQALLRVYQLSPAVTRKRMYLETIQAILQNTSKILIDVNGSNNLLYLPLDKLLQDHSLQTHLSINSSLDPNKIPEQVVTSGEVKNDINS